MNSLTLAFSIVAIILSCLALAGMLGLYFFAIKQLAKVPVVDDGVDIVSLGDVKAPLDEAEIAKSNKEMEENIKKMFYRFAPEESEPENYEEEAN